MWDQETERGQEMGSRNREKTGSWIKKQREDKKWDQETERGQEVKLVF